MSRVTERIPLFPLGAVLFPGLLIPLHIFEPRYRELIRHLVSLPPGSPRRFGVVAIREGREVGTCGVRSLHEVGCVAELGQVEAYDDGRFDTVSLGTTRFRLHAVDESLPYLQGDIEEIPEAPGDAGPVLADGVRRLFGTYRAALGRAQHETGGNEPEGEADDQLPDEPATLGYFVAAATVLEIGDQQRLLAATDDSARLRLTLDLLRRETAVLRALPSLPATELCRSPYGEN